MMGEGDQADHQGAIGLGQDGVDGASREAISDGVRCEQTWHIG